ncbi:hypothetical protein [Streptomyces platensis]|nr:hypothetical protein OG229_35155 [Streptomyces platensis]WUB83978.1 hypothetical protein OG424_35135 [Streptomyces platensis]
MAGVILAAGIGLTGCADVEDAKPETKTFPFDGKTLNVRSHDIATDLVAADRKDVKVTRWFDVGIGADEESSWSLKKGTLDLQAACGKIANCDVRFRVEVPKSLKVLRNGRATDLKGAKNKAAGARPSVTTPVVRSWA